MSQAQKKSAVVASAASAASAPESLVARYARWDEILAALFEAAKVKAVADRAFWQATDAAIKAAIFSVLAHGDCSRINRLGEKIVEAKLPGIAASVGKDLPAYVSEVFDLPPDTIVYASRLQEYTCAGKILKLFRKLYDSPEKIAAVVATAKGFSVWRADRKAKAAPKSADEAIKSSLRTALKVARSYGITGDSDSSYSSILKAIESLVK